MAVTVALLAAVVFLYSYDEPVDFKVELTDLGIFLRNELYRYNQIKAFWFILDGEYKAFCFNLAGRWPKTFIVQVKDDDISKIRALLSKVVPEDSDRKESLFAYFGRKMKL